MKINKISFIGGLVGLGIIILSIQRWWFVYYDPSQVAIGGLIGLIIIAFSYVYNWMREIDERIKKFNHKLEQISQWWMKQELG